MDLKGGVRVRVIVQYVIWPNKNYCFLPHINVGRYGSIKGICIGITDDDESLNEILPKE